MNINLKKILIGLVLFAFCLTPVVWFIQHGNALINGLDTNFPLNPAVWLSRRFFVWYATANAGSDFSSSTSGLIFHLVQAIPFYLGANLHITELLSIVFWFSAVVLASFYFAKSIVPDKKLAQLLFVAFYTFNLYLFNTWENVKVSNLALVVGLPLFLGFLINYRNGKLSMSKITFYSAVASVISLGSAINPGYFAAMVAGIILFAFLIQLFPGRERNRKQNALAAMVTVTIILLVNLLWILPLSNFLFLSNKSSDLSDLGYTDWIKSLSENTGLDNVVRLQGAWDWYVKDRYGTPIYIPYAQKYFDDILFIAFSFVIPLISSVSLMFLDKAKKLYYLAFSIFLILGIFFAAGVHKPTGYIFQFLIDHLPFFSFFRSPWYIFTPYTVIAFAGLSALLAQRLLSGSKRLKVISGFGIVLLIVANCFYTYPQITGAIFRPGRQDSFYITFPDYVFKAGEWFDKNPSDRVLTYPDDLVETFEWGYRGTDSIVGLLSNTEFISPSFNSSTMPVSSIISQYYYFIKTGQIDSIKALGKILNVNTILVKNDASTQVKKIDAKSFSSAFEKSSVGQWDFYSFRAPDRSTKIYIPEVIYQTKESPGSLAAVSPVLANNFASVLSSDSEVGRAGLNIGNTFVEAKNKASDEKQTNETQSYNLAVPMTADYKIALERKKVSGATLIIGGQSVNPNTTTQGFFIWDKVHLPAGSQKIEVKYPTNTNLLADNDFSNYAANSGLRTEELPINPAKTLVLYNASAEDVRFSLNVPAFEPSSSYFFSANYKYFYGWLPGMDVTQRKGSERVRLYPMPLARISTDWQRIAAKINLLQADNSRLDIDFTLPHNYEESKSKTFIENLTLKKIYDNRLFLIESSSPVTTKPEITFKEVSPVKYEVSMKNVDSGYVLVFSDNYNKNWKLSGSLIENAPHFTVNGYANGWYVAPTAKNQTLTIYYTPQNLFNIGFAISILTLVTSSVFFVVSLRKKHVQKAN